MSACDPDGLEALVRGELGGERAAALRVHAEECRACAGELKWLRLERELVARARPQARPSGAEWAQLELRIAGRVANPGWPRRLRHLRGRRRMLVLAGVGAALAAAGLIAVLSSSGAGGGPIQGDRLTSARETIGLGGRGVAVAEADSDLSWRIRGDLAHIEQRRGNIFYRVEPRGRFVVRTPLGDVVVAGTCFRVELAAAVGAAAVTALTVTVYEGEVVVTNAAGRVELAAGELAQIEPGGAPSRVAAGAGGEMAAGGQPSREQLATRDRAQRERIAALEAKLAELERDRAAAARGARAKRAFEMSRDELRELAAQCDLPMDMPPIFGSSIGERVVEEAYAQAGYSAAEREVVQRAARRVQPGYEAAMRALYQEMTGSASAGESLDPETMLIEIVNKSPRDDIAEANKVLAEERAGLRRPPTRLDGGSIAERAFRLTMTASDAFARALAGELPDGRVREFRRYWWRMNAGRGCPDDGASGE